MRLPRWPALLFAPALALLIPGPVAALYRCTAPDGAVSFQQSPCFHGGGVELEAGDGFGVRPRPPGSAADAPEAARAASTGAPVTATGKTIYVGPRGGRYTLSPSGRKNYLPKSAEGVGTAAPAPRPAQAAPDIHVGARGGCYTLGRTGRKNYLPRAQCPGN